MPTALGAIAEELAPLVERWKGEAGIVDGWRITSGYTDDSLYLCTETTSWPFLNRNEIDDFHGNPQALDREFSSRAKSIMQQDRDIKSRLRGKTYSIAS